MQIFSPDPVFCFLPLILIALQHTSSWRSQKRTQNYSGRGVSLCRNPKCRSKLKEPTSNLRDAFCAPVNPALAVPVLEDWARKGLRERVRATVRRDE